MTTWSTPEAAEFAANTGHADPTLAMRVVCRGLLDRCGVRSVPVALNTLFRELSVRRVIAKDMVLEGALKVRECDGFSVLVKRDRPLTRRRFSIAHECGHVLFYQLAPHAKYRQREHKLRAPREEELLCNVAAEEILMPKFFVDELLGKFGYDLSGAAVALAQGCQVSVHAALIRLASAYTGRGCLQLWERATDAWQMTAGRRLGKTRRRLDHFAPALWVDQFPAVVAGMQSWERAGWIQSTRDGTHAVAASGGRKVSSSRLVVHHILLPRRMRKDVEPLESARRARLKRAHATEALPNCPSCHGLGHYWVGQRTVATCKCRFRCAAPAVSATRTSGGGRSRAQQRGGGARRAS